MIDEYKLDQRTEQRSSESQPTIFSDILHCSQ